MNVIVSTCSDECMGDIQVDPVKGTVAFGSGLMQWGFTLTRFAKMYAKKFKTDEEKMKAKLWGDWFFDAAGKKWVTDCIGTDGKTLSRAFCQFIIDPIVKIFSNCMVGKTDTVFKMIASLGVELSTEEKELQEKKLIKVIMQRWLNAADALLEMMILNLPSPVKSQAYRTEIL